MIDWDVVVWVLDPSIATDLIDREDLNKHWFVPKLHFLWLTCDMMSIRDNISILLK